MRKSKESKVVGPLRKSLLMNIGHFAKMVREKQPLLCVLFLIEKNENLLPSEQNPESMF
jgi:hypothetical protein